MIAERYLLKNMLCIDLAQVARAGQRVSALVLFEIICAFAKVSQSFLSDFRNPSASNRYGKDSNLSLNQLNASGDSQ
jgi:hypothetical protein